MTLHIAPDLDLPDDAVTQTFAILAKRGVGKTYTASVLVEELLKANLHTVIADPVGVWWGLRSSADGAGPGLPIIILGGDHADVDISPTSGEIIADLVVDEKVSCVLDLSNFTGNEQVKFMQAFAERLYLRNRAPLHLVLDEADAFAPQSPMPDERRMLGAMEKLVRRGRARGIGVTLITQRPAVLNKSVLTQVEVLIALRTIGPQDRKALDAWISVHGTEEQRHALLDSLPSLPIGDAWFWSPAWLDVFQRVHIRKRETFDSSATPKVGDVRMEPKAFAEVDMAGLRERIGATLEQTTQDDPKELRRRIAELEAQLHNTAPVQPVIERVEVPVLDQQQIGAMSAAVEGIKVPAEIMQITLNAVLQSLASIQDALNSIPETGATIPDRGDDPEVTAAPQLEGPPPSIHPTIPLNAQPSTLRAGERRMLFTLARMHPRPITRVQLATLSGFAVSGGTFGTYLSTLRRQGYALESGGHIRITPAGMTQLGLDAKPLTPLTTQEIQKLWSEPLRQGERRMLQELINIYPKDRTKEVLATITGFAVSGGTFGTYLSTLRRNGLVKVTGNRVKASDALFLGDSK